MNSTNYKIYIIWMAIQYQINEKCIEMLNYLYVETNKSFETTYTDFKDVRYHNLRTVVLRLNIFHWESNIFVNDLNHATIFFKRWINQY